MRIMGRFILLLYGLCIAAISVLAIVGTALVGAGQVNYEQLYDITYDFFSKPSAAVSIMIISVLVFIISIKLAFKGTNNRNEREPIIKVAAGGEIVISLETFESIIVSALRKISEAKEYTARVKKREEGVTVTINLSVLPEVNIPQLGENIQVRTIEAIESMTGVKVLNVRVKIENISSGFKNRLD